MSRLTWVRLIDGRLWHVDQAQLITVCGAPIRTDEPKQPEMLEELLPVGAWVCSRCVRELRRQADQAMRMALRDPRRQIADDLTSDADPTTELDREDHDHDDRTERSDTDVAGQAG